jgi:hypothetical protein
MGTSTHVQVLVAFIAQQQSDSKYLSLFLLSLGFNQLHLHDLKPQLLLPWLFFSFSTSFPCLTFVNMEQEKRVDDYIDCDYCYVSLNHICDRIPNINFCYESGTFVG